MASYEWFKIWEHLERALDGQLGPEVQDLAQKVVRAHGDDMHLTARALTAAAQSIALCRMCYPFEPILPKCSPWAYDGRDGNRRAAPASGPLRK